MNDGFLFLNQPVELLQPVVGIFDLVQLFARVLQLLNQAVLVCVVFALQPPQRSEPVFDAVIFLIGKIHPIPKIAQRFRGVLQSVYRILHGSRQGGKLTRISGGAADGVVCLRGQRDRAIVPPGKQVISQIHRFGKLFKVAQQLAPLSQLSLFPGLELRLLQLFDLVAETVGEKFLFAFIGRECFMLFAKRGIFLIFRRIGGHLRIQTAKLIQIPQMLPLVEQLLAVVLAVNVQQKTAERAQLRRGDRHPADAACGLAIGCDLAADDQLVVAFNLIFRAPLCGGLRVERGADDGFFRTAAHQLPRNAPAEHGMERVDQNRLARAGLARQDIQPGSERDVCAFDHRDVFNMQFVEQTGSPPGADQSIFSISLQSAAAAALSFITRNAVSSPASVPTRDSISMLSSVEQAAEASPGSVLTTMMFCASA